MEDPYKSDSDATEDEMDQQVEILLVRIDRDFSFHPQHIFILLEVEKKSGSDATEVEMDQRVKFRFVPHRLCLPISSPAYIYLKWYVRRK